MCVLTCSVALHCESPADISQGPVCLLINGAIAREGEHISQVKPHLKMFCNTRCCAL